jgi:hypothetical protein
MGGQGRNNNLPASEQPRVQRKRPPSEACARGTEDCLCKQNGIDREPVIGVADARVPLQVAGVETLRRGISSPWISRPKHLELPDRLFRRDRFGARHRLPSIRLSESARVSGLELGGADAGSLDAVEDAKADEAGDTPSGGPVAIENARFVFGPPSGKEPPNHGLSRLGGSGGTGPLSLVENSVQTGYLVTMTESANCLSGERDHLRNLGRTNILCQLQQCQRPQDYSDLLYSTPTEAFVAPADPSWRHQSSRAADPYPEYAPKTILHNTFFRKVFMRSKT